MRQVVRALSSAGYGRAIPATPMNEFFSSLARRWGDAARRRGAKIDDPTLDADVADEILELARVVAHTKERRFAPIATSPRVLRRNVCALRKARSAREPPP